MAIGRYCQLCGHKKGVWDVISEVRGVTVTSDCLMEKVFIPEHADQVDLGPSLIRFCRYCGVEQQPPIGTHCQACNKPLTPRAAQADLQAKGAKASLRERTVAFLIDFIIIALLTWGLIFLWRYLYQGTGWEIEYGYKSILSIGSFAFVSYHTLFTWLLNMSPGKMVMGLKILMDDGSEEISFIRSLVRSFLYIFTIYVLPIGLIPLVLDEPREGWLKVIYEDALLHGPLTDTAVIKLESINT